MPTNIALLGDQGLPPKLKSLHAFISSSLVQSLLSLHPNELAIEKPNVPQEKFEWLDWSSNTPQGWLELVHYYMAGVQECSSSLYVTSNSTEGNKLPSIPGALRHLLDQVKSLQLPRYPVTLKSKPPQIRETGMSPKKAHEVSRMATYVLEIIRINGWDSFNLKVVDIGAGQGYLTRALKAFLPQTHILALDADVEQTIGAQRWENRLLPRTSSENPPITHKTIHITPKALYATIDEWIMEINLSSPLSAQEENAKIPVLLVGLHACGSLTPDIIRTFHQSGEEQNVWKFAGVVVVGCCYNLMNPGDFPLSQCMKDFIPALDLPTSAYQLAAQIPTQWLSNISPPIPVPSVELALRKVTWRALLGKKLQQMQDGFSLSEVTMANINLAPGRQLPWSRRPPAKSQNFDTNEIGTGATPELRKLGRLKDGAYKDWATFLDVAGQKMGADFGSVAEDGGMERDVELERFLEVVHTLRCILGPVIETAFVLDRMAWIDEDLEKRGSSDIRAAAVNLFDQATGSGRNIAIVMAPLIPPIL